MSIEVEEATILGEINQVQFQSEDTGYCILKIKEAKSKNIHTILGYTVNPQIGQEVKAIGTWVTNAHYGKQLKAHTLTPKTPRTRKAIVKYLSSGMISGIGEKLAQTLYDKFGNETIDIIEKNPIKLTKISGIGKKRAEAISKAWHAQYILTETLLFLYQHNITHNRAIRIYHTYGEQTIHKIQENPYQLYLDISGIGFKLADQIALSLGIKRDSAIRIQHALLYVLENGHQSGHTALPTKNVIEEMQKKLDLQDSTIQDQLQNNQIKHLIYETTIDTSNYYYMKKLYIAEVETAYHIKRLCKKPGMVPTHDEIQHLLPKLESYLGYTLTSQQHQALEIILTNKVSILTGGPGVGKTTLVQSLVRILQQLHRIISLCAPTGKAAKRLRESTGCKATTIHRALSVDPVTRRFQHDDKNPLKIEFCIIDESSMIDIHLAHHLLKAIPDHSSLLLVGDVDQLPSVGPGTVLRDMIETQRIAVVALTEIFRQAQTSAIVQYAHSVRQGIMPLFQTAEQSDCYFIERSDSNEIIDTIKKLILQRIPTKFGLDPRKDIQILCPMHRGDLGTLAMNRSIQTWLNSEIDKDNKSFKLHDKVIQVRNNYDKDVFNGDSGTIIGIDSQNKFIQVDFDDKVVNYDFSECDEIQLAYAISIHKSQGSEFPCVIIPVSTSQYMMLERNIIYTGMTRSKKLLIFVGQKKALRMALQKNQTAERIGFLDERLHQAFSMS